MRGIWRLAVPLAFGCAGVLFVTSAGAARGGDLRGGQRTDLTDLIRVQEQRVTDAGARVARLREEVAAGTKDAAAADQRVAAEQTRADRLTFGAGLGAVSGPGLRVTLSDAPRSADRLLPEGASPDDVVVHQQDVQGVVNALWSAGADAVQIMDQRVIVTSAVRCVGSTLILQGRVYFPPYTVTAIGDPDRLSQALDASPAVQLFRYYVDRYGLVYQTSRHGDLRLPGYSGSLDLLYARATP